MGIARVLNSLFMLVVKLFCTTGSDVKLFKKSLLLGNYKNCDTNIIKNIYRFTKSTLKTEYKINNFKRDRRVKFHEFCHFTGWKL